MSWFNNDKLLLKFGTEKATAVTGGSYRRSQSLTEVEIKLTLTTLGSTAGGIVNDQVVIPVGARLEEVEVVAQTAATGSGATLNLGLVRTADRTTEYDFDGLLAALPLASFDAAGEKTVVRPGSSGAGALLGATTATYPTLLTADWDTAAFTAGVLLIRIRYYAI